MNDPTDDAIDALLRQQFEGSVADDGFSERVMQQLPPRRRRIAWPVWASHLAGVAICWLSLRSSPLLLAGWRDWASGSLSSAAVALLIVTAGMSLLALGWSLTEADDHRP